MIKSVWQGRDNTFVLRFDTTDQGGVTLPVDMRNVTKMILELQDSDTLTVNEDQADAGIDWWDAGLDEGEAKFQLGEPFAGVPASTYRARLTLYSDTSPDGVVWASFVDGELSISVHETVGEPEVMGAFFITDNLGDQLTDDEGNPLEG